MYMKKLTNKTKEGISESFSTVVTLERIEEWDKIRTNF